MILGEKSFLSVCLSGKMCMGVRFVISFVELVFLWIGFERRLRWMKS